MISFVVYGTPAPQGSKRFVGTSKAGRGILVESSRKVLPWREAVKHAALQVRPSEPLDGPLSVTMTFTLARPASAPKRRRWPDRMPDLSKLVRSTEDAITDAGLWTDDARIVSCLASKVYVGGSGDALASPGVRVEVLPWQT